MRVNVNIDYISKANLKQDKAKENEPHTAVFRSPARKERGVASLAPKGLLGSPSTQKSLAGVHNGGSVQGRNTLLNEPTQRSVPSGRVYSSGQ